MYTLQNSETDLNNCRWLYAICVIQYLFNTDNTCFINSYAYFCYSNYFSGGRDSKNYWTHGFYVLSRYCKKALYCNVLPLLRCLWLAGIAFAEMTIPKCDTHNSNFLQLKKLLHVSTSIELQHRIWWTNNCYVNYIVHHLMLGSLKTNLILRWTMSYVNFEF